MLLQSPPTASSQPGLASLPHINGVPLQRSDETLEPEQLRQRGCMELLRQAAIAAGLLDASDLPGIDGIVSEEASAAIDILLERELRLPEPSEEACRRHYAAHARSYRSGERLELRHILFAVTPGMDVVALRNRAETCLLAVRCHDDQSTDGFARAARELSNCPSGADGGALGWLASADCAPEFAREIFGQAHVGVLPRLVHSRFGLHVVEVLARENGTDLAFEAVHGAVAQALRQTAYVTALRQYLRVLAGATTVHGVDLQASDTPLVQ